jgi:hypothetical protein
MSRSAVALASALALALSAAEARAVAPPPHGSRVSPSRAEPLVSYGDPPPARRDAWERFLVRAGSRAWQALWDRDTGAPLRVFGKGIPAPGTVADPAIAAAHARDFLRDHAALLAPGVALAELDLAANDLDRGMRTVAFLQRAPLAGGGSVPVIGGRASLRYKNDRLFVIASELVAIDPLPPARVDASTALAAARAWVAPAHAYVAPNGPPELVARPLVGGGRVEIHLAYRVIVDAHFPRARWAIDVDAETGVPLAREDQLRFDQATVAFDTPIRAPQLGRQTYVAPRLDLTIDGAASTTDAAGLASWASTGMPASIVLGVSGPLVSVKSQAGAPASATMMGSDGAQILWSLADDEYGDAQLTAFIHAGLIKEHARGIAPAMTFLSQKLPVLPNEDDPQGCNAFWDGSALNFYRQNALCNNTARVPDVVYHEFGHAFHQNAVIPGAGALDPSLGEAAGDTMSASYTHDHHLAPGFYLSGDASLRELANTARWPDDISSFDPHETGLIWGGAMWDLRVRLTGDLGDAAGHQVTDRLYYEALRRSSSIPATYAEILAADDDDGDLSNGTPHVCAVNHAFLLHGLAPVADESGLSLAHAPATIVDPGAPVPIEVESKRLYPQCAATANIDSIGATFHRLGAAPGSSALTEDAGSWSGALPAQPDGTALRYAIVASIGDGTLTLPDNPADPEYRVFFGKTTPIYCNDFETQIDGWTFGDTYGKPGDFEWGEPQGLAGDPASAFSGKKVIGDRLTGDGTYAKKRTNFATSPVIDVGAEKHVRLQFRRWLTVEDGAADQATIYVNDQPVWQNAGTDQKTGSLDHVDREWRFEDIDLSSRLALGATTVQVRFELASDGEKQLGGWNVDDVCIVAWHPEEAMADAGADGGSTPPPEPSGCACGVARGGDSGLASLGPLAALALAAWIKARRAWRSSSADPCSPPARS